MSLPPNPAPVGLRECFRIGIAGARKNLVPGLALQAVAAGLVAAYYLSPTVQEALAGFTAWRLRTGLPSSALMTAIFGGFLPWLYLTATLRGRERPGLFVGVFLTVFWGIRGIDVELFYRLQAMVFGTGNDPLTLILKVIADQLTFSMLYAVPVTALVYAWKDAGFKKQAIQRFFLPGWYRRQVLPMLISNFLIWFPACTLVYSMPMELQLPLFGLVLCFFTLLVAHVSRSTQERAGSV